MNEDELKQLWKSADANDLPNINFEQVQKNISLWQNKLRRKIKIDVIINSSIIIALIPICFILPKLVYFIPIVVLLPLWGYWKLWQVYKQETTSNNLQNAKEFLIEKISLLTNYIRVTRIMSYLSVPFLVVATLLVQVTSTVLLEVWVRVVLLIVFFEIFAIIFCEIYFKIMYIPEIKESKKLLEELESE